MPSPDMDTHTSLDHTEASTETMPTHKRTTTVASNTSNAFFKSTNKTSSEEASHAQDTPRYVTRQTAREMAKASEEATKVELAKLGLSSVTENTFEGAQRHRPSGTAAGSHSTPLSGVAYRSTLTDNHVRGTSAHRLNMSGGCSGGTSGNILDASFAELPGYGVDPSAHHLMHQYAEKQHALCNQICVLNQRLQQTQDQYMRLKETYHTSRTDYEDQLAHLNEVSSGYDEEVNTLTEKLKAEQVTNTRLNGECKEVKDSFNTLVFSIVMVCLSGVAMFNVQTTHTAADPFTQHGSLLSQQVAENMSNATEWVSTMFGVF